MPQKRPLKGVGAKEQRQYEHIKESAEKSGRYGDRAEEVLKLREAIRRIEDIATGRVQGLTEEEYRAALK